MKFALVPIVGIPMWLINNPRTYPFCCVDRGWQEDPEGLELGEIRSFLCRHQKQRWSCSVPHIFPLLFSRVNTHASFGPYFTSSEPESLVCFLDL